MKTFYIISFAFFVPLPVATLLMSMPLGRVYVFSFWAHLCMLPYNTILARNNC